MARGTGREAGAILPADPQEWDRPRASDDGPGSILTFPIGVNNNGLITMQYLDGNFTWHSATLKNGTYTIVDVPGAVGSLVSAPNMQGQVALAYWLDDVAMHAALYARFPCLPARCPRGGEHLSQRHKPQGQISGTTWSDNFYVVHGYVWDGTDYEVFDHPITDIVLIRLAPLDTTGCRS